jgi:hypothetical protein
MWRNNADSAKTILSQDIGTNFIVRLIANWLESDW